MYYFRYLFTFKYIYIYIYFSFFDVVSSVVLHHIIITDNGRVMIIIRIKYSQSFPL